MNKSKALFSLIGFFLIFAGFARAQTTINAGSISGTWSKAGSPYLINGDVYVPQGQTLHVTQGVKVEFQGSYTLHVWGSIQAIGVIKDSVIFTAKTIATGWKGIYMHKNLSGADSNILRHCRLEYAKYAEYSLQTRGAVGFDSLTNLEISHCRFYRNTSNTGTCIRGTRTSFKITDCIFHYNLSTDQSTTVPSGWEPNGSAITSVFGDLTIDNCLFINNTTNAPKDSRDTTVGLGYGVVFCYNANFSIDHSRFEGNYSSLGTTIKLYPLLSGNKTYSIRNVDFINNINGFEPLIAIDNGGHYSGIVTTVQNCRFIGNSLTRGDYKQICMSAYSGGGSGNNVYLDNCLFYKNHSSRTRINVLEFYNSVNAFVTNCRFIGNSAQAINFYRSGKLRIFNSLFANNYEAITSGLNNFTSDIVLSNCAFVNNALPSADSAKFKGKLYYLPNHALSVGGPDDLNIYNSIFWGNLGDKGKPANILTENIQSGGRISLFQNNYLQGGMSSTTNNKGGQANMIVRNNMYTDTLIFVKPSLGAGPAFADTTSDWHIINTCTNIPAVYNKGYAAIKDGSNTLVKLPSTDLNGQARIQQDTIDIGVYETNGLKARTVLRAIPGPDSICFSDKKLLKSRWDGLGLTFVWEKSPDGMNNWQLIQSADSSNFQATPSVSTYYRVTAMQNECGRTDTSPVFFLKVRPLPKMLRGPKGDSVCPGKPVHLSSIWSGGQLVYTWETSSDGIKDWQKVETSDSSDLYLYPAGNNYYHLRVNSAGCNSDSISNTIAVGLFPVPLPELGKDTTINQNQTIVLNPGSFASYHWSTGAFTPTLLINGATAPLGTKSYSVTVTNLYGCLNSDTVNITVERKTGLRSHACCSWKVYPVPGNGTLNIEPSDDETYTFILTDIQGRILIEKKVSGSFQIVNLQPGQYLLMIRSDNESRKMMIVVQ